jgi:hypothetical protein
MAIGLGQMLIGGLIGSQLGKGGLLGSDDEDKQPQQGGAFGGIGGMVTGISNELFKGMSQEQVARLGMGFNSMRLNPSDNLAASFQTTINDSIAKAKLTKQTNNTIDYLQNSVSDAYPNGRTDIINMLSKGIISPTDAITMSRAKPSTLAEKFTKYDNLKQIHGGADKIPAHELALLNITQNEVNSIEEFEYYKNGLKPGETALTYLEFLELGSPTTTITVEGDKIVEENNFWKKYNDTMIPEVIDWQTTSADTKGNIVKLMDVLEQLSDPNALLTGPLIGQMPDFVMNFLNPEAVGAREAVESVVQRNLKAVLGGQFTEREGEKLVKRAYNPQLSQEENAKRLRILIEQMVRAAEMQDARMAWIMDDANNGSFRGFNGEIPTLDDFFTALSSSQKGDIVCDTATGNAQKCYEYLGGDDKSKASWKLVEK